MMLLIAVYIFLDPPSFESGGPSQYFALLGNSLSLVCGTGLDSNPQANITWTAPDGTTVVGSDRYDFEDGPERVALNVSNTLLSDSGVWRCDVNVISSVNVLNGGRVLLLNDILIGSYTNSIQLTVFG